MLTVHIPSAGHRDSPFLQTHQYLQLSVTCISRNMLPSYSFP